MLIKDTSLNVFSCFAAGVVACNVNRMICGLMANDFDGRNLSR